MNRSAAIAPSRPGVCGLACLIAALLCLLPAGRAVSQERRVALVLGIDHYAKLGPEAQLSVAVSDAKRMADALRAVDPPFETTLLTDPDWRTAEDAFEKFLDQASGAACALIYFAGHGIEYHGANYLLVNDTEVPGASPDIERMKRRLGTTALSMQSWVDSLDQTMAQVKVVVLDCCRNNPLQIEGGSGTRSLVGTGKGLAQLSPPSGTLISYSADAGQRANDGLFTEVLTKHMLEPGVPLLQVFAATREEVSATSAEWASEDEANGLPPDRRRVHHEPAEYTKLNVAGTRFAFNLAASRPMPTLKSLEELGIGVAKPSDDAAEKAKVAEQMAAWRKISESVRAMKEGQPTEAAPPAPAPAPSGSMLSNAGTSVIGGGFSLQAAMLGRSAGEARTIHGIPVNWCPPGTFTMGSGRAEEEGQETQAPFQATLSRGFWIARTELTQEQWKEVKGTGVRDLMLSDDYAQGPTHPVAFVGWTDAQDWIAKMNEEKPLPMGWRWALPTEAQWEYACRAGTTTPFSFGSTLNGEQANCDGRYPYQSSQGPSLDRAVAVASYPANPWGLFDMHGNVTEWVEDRLGDYPAGAATDPRGPQTGESRVLRGGSWIANGFGCRSGYRAYGQPQERSASIGFRPVIVLDPQ